MIHHIWLNPPLPSELTEYVDSWRAHHPEWEFRSWDDWPTDGDGERAGAAVDLRPYFDAAPHLATKSDILRIELVWRYGGVYVDCDIECHKPIDDLLAGCDAFFASEYVAEMYGIDGPSGIGNGLFGASPGHPAIAAIMGEVARAAEAVTGDSPTDVLATGPRVFRSVVHERSDVRIFEQDIFNALLPHEVNAGERTISPRAYATHWFRMSWARPSGKKG